MGRSETELSEHKIIYGEGGLKECVLVYLPNRSYPAIGKNDLRLTNTN